MAFIAYKSKWNIDHSFAKHIVAGFTKQLKGWWDNVLTDEGKRMILHNIDENRNQNAVHTLIFTITKHFLGEPTIFQERALEILANLRWRKLEDFRWYKVVYLSKVYTRTDTKQSCWKERFLHDLPRTLVERVQIKIKEKSNGIIPYNFPTYEELIDFIN